MPANKRTISKTNTTKRTTGVKKTTARKKPVSAKATVVKKVMTRARKSNTRSAAKSSERPIHKKIAGAFAVWLLIVFGAIGIVGVATASISYAASVTGTIVGPGGKCLDNYNARVADGNKIQLWKCNNTVAQQWTISDDGTIKVQGYCLDVTKASKRSQTLVQLYKCNGTMAQKWVVNTTAKTIINSNTGLCLDARNGSTADGTRIWMYKCNGTAAQQWTTPKAATTTPSPTPTPAPTPQPTPAPSPAPSTGSGVTPFEYGATGATNTTLRATLSPGATHAQINTAIQNASNAGGGIVRLNAGTYTINGRIVMRSNVKLEGPDVPTGTQPTAVLKAGSSFMTNPMYGGYSMITNASGAKNWTLDDIMADQSGDVLNGNKDADGRLSAYLVEARGATNVVFDQVWTRRPFTYSIVMVDTTKFGIRNSDTQVNTAGKYDQLDGIHVLQGSYGDVVDNHVDQGFTGTKGDGDDGLVAHTIDAVAHHINYRNNWVRGGRHGSSLQLAGGSYNIYDIVIQNNTFVCDNATDDGVKFGYYGSSKSAIERITVGGASGKGNYFVDCRAFAVDFDDGPARSINVQYNGKDSATGGYHVPSGNGNIVANNTVGSLR
jgi:hypothetical protein